MGRGPSGARAQRSRVGGGDGEPCVLGHEMEMGRKKQVRVDGVGLEMGGGQSGRMRTERSLPVSEMDEGSRRKRSRVWRVEKRRRRRDGRDDGGGEKWAARAVF